MSTPANNCDLLTCQMNSYALKGFSKVVSCKKLDGANEGSFEVLMEDSVLYPEGGGQPCDLGTVQGYPVKNVVKSGDGDNLVLVTVEDMNSSLATAVTEGSTVECEVDWKRRYDFMQQHTAQHLFSAVAETLFHAHTTGWGLGKDVVTVDLQIVSSPSSVECTADGAVDNDLVGGCDADKAGEIDGSQAREGMGGGAYKKKNNSNKNSGKVSSSKKQALLLTAADVTAIEAEVNRRIASAATVEWVMYSKDSLIAHQEQKQQQQQQMTSDAADTATATATATPNATVTAASSSDASSSSNTGSSNTHAADFSLLRGAPKGAALTLSQLRMVHIAGLDLNPCGGTHVKNLAEINVLKVLGMEKERQGVRVRFVAGQRALDYFSQCITRESALSSLLSAPPSTQVSAVEKLLSERKLSNKCMDIHLDELAVYWGQNLLQTTMRQQSEAYSLNGRNPADAITSTSTTISTSISTTTGTTSAVPVRAPMVIASHRPGADLKFLLKAASSILDTDPNALVYLSGDSSSPVATSATGNATAGNSNKGKKDQAASLSTPSSLPPPPTPPTTAATPSAAAPACSGVFVLFGQESVVAEVKAPLLALVGGKGGGRPGRLQGTAVHLERIDEVEPLLLLTAQ